jgi:MoaA/NifB/PqqE/SkfB family radical SAM enzyme
LWTKKSNDESVVFLMNKQHIQRMNGYLTRFFGEAVCKFIVNPPMAWFLLKTLLRQRSAIKRRMALEKQGLHVPPYLIASITHRCNLKCQGCYARVHHREESPLLSMERWGQILKEARDLGISVVMIAGGEPLTRREFIDLTQSFPDIIFPVFTNGLLFDEALIQQFKRQKNVIPMISIEGFGQETDERRGMGIYTRVRNTIRQLKLNGLLFGLSVTVTRENFSTVTHPDFVHQNLAAGAKVFIYVEYTPIEPNTEHLILNHEQRVALGSKMGEFQARSKGLFVNFPGDEELYGGCLAAGRGFVHISPEGNFEPCPFAPYSDTNVREASLREALQSKFLQEIRKNHRNLVETAGGCALWNNREWVLSQLTNKNNVEITR